MAREIFHIRLRDTDVPRAVEIKRLLNIYKAEHGLRSVFEALAEIVEQATARPKK